MSIEGSELKLLTFEIEKELLELPQKIYDCGKSILIGHTAKQSFEETYERVKRRYEVEVAGDKTYTNDILRKAEISSRINNDLEMGEISVNIKRVSSEIDELNLKQRFLRDRMSVLMVLCGKGE